MHCGCGGPQNINGQTLPLIQSCCFFGGTPKILRNEIKISKN